MRLTTRGRYALRAMLALARLGKTEELVSVNALSEEENISSVFLEQIFFKLKKTGFVKSSRGPGGGFAFALPLEQITVKDIIEAAGDDLSENFCDRHEDDCERLPYCVSHQVWATVTEMTNNYLSSLTLAALAETDSQAQQARKEPRRIGKAGK